MIFTTSPPPTISWKSSHDPFKRKSRTIEPRLLWKRFFCNRQFFAIGIHTCIRIRHSAGFPTMENYTTTRLFDEAQHGRLRCPQLQFSPERDELWTIEFGQYRGFQSAADKCAQTGFCPVVIRSNQRATVDCFAFRIVLFSLFSIDVIILHTIRFTRHFIFFFFFRMKEDTIYFLNRLFRHIYHRLRGKLEENYALFSIKIKTRLFFQIYQAFRKKNEGGYLIFDKYRKKKKKIVKRKNRISGNLNWNFPKIYFKIFQVIY